MEDRYNSNQSIQSQNNVCSSNSTDNTDGQIRSKKFGIEKNFISKILQSSKKIDDNFKKVILKNIHNVCNVVYVDQGSSNYVYKADMYDRNLKKSCCSIKLNHSQSFDEGFQREIDIQEDISQFEEEFKDKDLKQNIYYDNIDPSGIIKYYHSFKDGFINGVIMEYCNATLEVLYQDYEGEYKEIIKKTFFDKNNISRDLNFMNLILQILKALNFLHYEGQIGQFYKQSYIHRDIKPKNIMMQIDGINQFTIKIIDLGGLTDKNEDENIDQVFTKAYLSPEQIKFSDPNNTPIEPIQGKCYDIWALGICLYQLFAIKEKLVEMGKDFQNIKVRNEQIYNNLTAERLRKIEGRERRDEVYNCASDILNMLLSQSYRDREQKEYLNQVISRVDDCVQQLITITQSRPEQSKYDTVFQEYKLFFKNGDRITYPDKFVNDSLTFLIECQKFNSQYDYIGFFNQFANFIKKNFNEQYENFNNYNQMNLLWFIDKKEQKFSQNDLKQSTLNILKNMLRTIYNKNKRLKVDQKTKNILYCTYYLANLYFKLQYYLYIDCFNECLYSITSFKDIQTIDLAQIQDKIISLVQSQRIEQMSVK